MFVLSHMLRMCLAGVCTYVRSCAHIYMFTHVHACLMSLRAKKDMDTYVQVVSEASSLQWKSRGDEVVRMRAMHRRACQIRHSLDSFGTKVACAREVSVHARNNPKMGIHAKDYDEAPGSEAMENNETSVRTPLVLGGTRQDLGWLASVPWQLEPSSSWQVLLLMSHSLVIVSSRYCCWMMMRLWLFMPFVTIMR